MRLGIDIDGVLVDFNTSFIERCIAVTGKDLFPSRPFDIPIWHYPQYYGYSDEEMNYKKGPVWGSVQEDPLFWELLHPYETTESDIKYLNGLAYGSHVIYFITNRDGVDVHEQTRRWLNRYGVGAPTVLISAEKGLCAKALKLDGYVDDKHENVIDVVQMYPACKTFIMDRPWNREPYMREEQETRHIARVSRVEGCF